MRRALAAALAISLLAGCSWTRGGAAARTLPADRDAPIVYVALGDSTVEGIGASRPELNYVSRLSARLREVYRHARVENLGVGGATSIDVLARQLERAVALAPDLVTLSVGPNDITERVPLADYTRNVETIFRRLVAETGGLQLRVVSDLAVTPRFRGHEAEAMVARRSIEFNAALARLAKRHGVDIVDLYAPSQREVPARPELMAGDGYHPSDVGYARWAELMWEAIRSRIRA